VKKFAGGEKTREPAAFFKGRRSVLAVGRTHPREPTTASRAGFGLARMLRPQTIAMTTDATSMMTLGRTIQAEPRQPVAKPRGLSVSPSFFCFSYLRESFHKSVGTHSRPLRGGKDGSVCRVM
jgi:hypothetical protein